MYRLQKKLCCSIYKTHKDKNEGLPVTGCGTHRAVRHRGSQIFYTIGLQRVVRLSALCAIHTNLMQNWNKYVKLEDNYVGDYGCQNSCNTLTEYNREWSNGICCMSLIHFPIDNSLYYSSFISFGYNPSITNYLC
jgi:hypothetical protein